MEILALANQKGGCGKTTAAVNLASALAGAGQRVLLVDLDPQAHATLGLGQADYALSVADVFLERVPLSRAMRPLGPGFHLLPGSLRLAEFEERAAQELGAERVLERALDEVSPLFDWTLVDCPTRADGVLAANAVRAATLVVLVVETGAFALQGAVRAERLFRDLAGELERDLDLRVLATLFDPGRSLAQEILIGMHARFGAAMFDTVIHAADELRDSIAYGLPVDEFAPRSASAERFRALASELVLLAGRRDLHPPRRRDFVLPAPSARP